MARAMVTLTWCDIHLTEKDEEVPGEHYTWGPMEVDLCDDCAVPVLTAQSVFTDYGSNGKRTMAPPPAAVKKAGAYPCPAPDCGAVLQNRASLGAHARQIHGQTLGQLEGRPITDTCEKCGAGFTTRQGITLHMRKHERDEAATPKRKRSAAKPQPAAQ